MRFFFVLVILLFFSVFGYCQSKDFSGIYSYGKSAEIGPVGNLYIYPKTDTTLIFYLELNIGPPSFNGGSLLGYITINHWKEANFTEFDSMNCSLKFVFQNDLILIKTKDEGFQCGLGHGVFADGEYNRTQVDAPAYFIDGTGEKVFFKEID